MPRYTTLLPIHLPSPNLADMPSHPATDADIDSPSSPSSSTILLPLAAQQQQQHQRYFARISHSPIYKPKTFGWSTHKFDRKFVWLVGSPCSYRGFNRAVLDVLVDDNDSSSSSPRDNRRPPQHQRRFLAQRYRRAAYRRDPFRYVHPPTRAWMDRVEELREGRDIAAEGSALLPLRDMDRRRGQELQQCDGQRRVDDDGDDEERSGCDDDGDDDDGHADEDDDVRELYRMGLLYDDEHERGSGFTLDAIAHDTASTPLYTLTVRDRDRDHHRRGKRTQHVQDWDNTPADIASDEALAAFLAEADYVDVCARDLLDGGDSDGGTVAAAGPSRKEGDVVEAMRAQQRLWEAFRGDRPSDLDGVEWEVV